MLWLKPTVGTGEKERGEVRGDGGSGDHAKPAVPGLSICAVFALGEAMRVTLVAPMGDAMRVTAPGEMPPAARGDAMRETVAAAARGDIGGAA